MKKLWNTVMLFILVKLGLYKQPKTYRVTVLIRRGSRSTIYRSLSGSPLSFDAAINILLQNRPFAHSSAIEKDRCSKMWSREWMNRDREVWTINERAYFRLQQIATEIGSNVPYVARRIVEYAVYQWRMDDPSTKNIAHWFRKVR